MKSKNLIGRRFGKLTALKMLDKRDKYGRVIWVVKCDCGIIKEMSSSDLQRVKSCGCLVKLHYKKKTALNRILRDYQGRARPRGYSFTLTKAQFENLIQQDCYYCGARPSNICKSRCGDKDYKYTGIDRLDNTKGYNLNNVVPCCAICNIMKMKLTQDKFIDQCKLIAKKHQ